MVYFKKVIVYNLTKNKQYDVTQFQYGGIAFISADYGDRVKIYAETIGVAPCIKILAHRHPILDGKYERYFPNTSKAEVVFTLPRDGAYITVATLSKCELGATMYAYIDIIIKSTIPKGMQLKTNIPKNWEVSTGPIVFNACATDLTGQPVRARIKAVVKGPVTYVDTKITGSNGCARFEFNVDTPGTYSIDIYATCLDEKCGGHGAEAHYENVLKVTGGSGSVSSCSIVSLKPEQEYGGKIKLYATFSGPAGSTCTADLYIDGNKADSKQFTVGSDALGYATFIVDCTKLSDGDHELKVCTGNSCKSVTITIKPVHPSPKIVVTVPTTKVQVGDTVTIAVTAYNLDGKTVGLYVNGTLIDEQVVSGDLDTFGFKFTPQSEGIYKVKVCEVGDMNVCSQEVVIEVSKKEIVKLVIDGPYVSPKKHKYETGDVITVSATLKNDGNVYLKCTDIMLYVDGNPVDSSKVSRIDLGPGETYTYSTKVKLNEEGTYKFKVCCDYEKLG